MSNRRMQKFNLLTRRAFLDRNFKIGFGVALSTLVDIPLVVKRALAEGTIGVPGPDGKIKKLLFIFLRGANDALNSLIPIQDPAYNLTNRPTLMIPADPGTDYSALGGCDFPQSSSAPGDANYATYYYANAIRLGNGFAALHPSLKFLAPVYNSGDLALLHRVAYPKQSRSHFDSQNYWENGIPNDNVLQEGILYRAMIESGLAASAPLTGVSIQSALPLILRGSAAAMTNLTDPTRYNLLGIPNTAAGNANADSAIQAANFYPFPSKQNRELLSLQYENLTQTLSIFAGIDFTEAGNTFVDDTNTDGDSVPYYLFPTSASRNGGYAAHGSDQNKFVVDSGAYSLFTNLKAAALVLNKTDAIVAGTEYTGFDTHFNQGGITGTHANLNRRLAWAMYALRKYFLNYPDKCTWDNMVVVTLSEFGRTTVENGNRGTDHAEAGVMFVAGGAVRGETYGCHPGDPIPWVTGQTGTMFGASSRYLKRAIDYRSVLGELVRDHLGATQNQLNRIIPGYTNPNEKLQTGGASGVDGVSIMGEAGLV